MRLYLNDKEARLIRVSLLMERVNMTDNQQDMVDTILDRMDLCDKLQNNERKSNTD